MTPGPLLLGITLDTVDHALLGPQALAAEAAAVDLVALDDPAGAPGTAGAGLDPIEAAAFVAALARTPALLATASVTHAEPFHLSNRLSSLDWGSSGRAGWLATVDASSVRARAYGLPTPARTDTEDEARGVVEAVRRLWDSWEDDALIADTATGRFLDADLLHYTDSPGATISVRGPALMPRPVQGQVPIFARDLVIDADVLLVDAPVTTTGPVVLELEVTPAEVVPAVRSVAGRVDGLLMRLPDAAAVLDVLGGPTPGTLRDDGLWRPVAGDARTLRERLGLDRPANRFAAAGAGR